MNPLPEITIDFEQPNGAAPVSGQTTPARNINDRPYHAKRPHKKSRAGCINCKTRKVKCNEQRPRCRACTLRKETCVYPTGQQQHSSSSAISTTSSSSQRPRVATTSAPSTAANIAAASSSASYLIRHSSDSSSTTSEDGSSAHFNRVYSRDASPGPYSSNDNVGHIGWFLDDSIGSGPSDAHIRGSASLIKSGCTFIDEPLFMPQEIDMTDMKLLWFYTAKGFDSFAAEAGRQPKVDEILKVSVPRHAFASRFLMDCLLALSAVELQLLNQPIDPSRVLMYRARAFAGYRKAVEEATPETYPALLACSLLLCALSSEMFREADKQPLYILNWMMVWRGIGIIVRLIQPEMLFRSGMSMLFARPPINLDASTKYIPNMLLFMVSSIRQDEPDYTHIDVYYETLKYLGSLYRELESGIGRILNLRTITWFTFVPAGFVEVAREHRPRALVILAHYLVFVKLCNRLWWMQGIADKEIKDVRNVLDEEWQSFITAPLAALDTDDEIALGKILLNNQSWQPDFIYDQTRDSQITSLSLVDNTGHNVVYDGTWIQVDTGKPAVWSREPAAHTAPATFQPDELIGLRRLSLEIPGESSSGDYDTANSETIPAPEVFP